MATRITETVGPIVPAVIANGGILSAEIDLGAVYESVELSMSPTEAGQLGVAAVTSLQAKDNGGNFNAVYNNTMAAVQGFSKPASGGVHVTFQNVTSRYIKVATSVATTAEVAFTVRGVRKLEFEPALERATIP